ncbi:MAG: SDR family NAD(P)-dependent oxidoreductase, partial [Pseudomonadota bacterium]
MSGQAALITGSSRGIGRAAAIALAREGFAIAVNGRSPDDDAFKATIDAVAAEGVPVTGAAFDVADISIFDQQLDAIEGEIGPLTTLVNNAGVGVMSRGDLLDVTVESYDRCLAVNTKALFFLCQAFSKRLVARKRDPLLYHSIINVTSSNA